MAKSYLSSAKLKSSIIDPNEFCPFAEKFNDRYSSLPNGISLRVVSFYPKDSKNYPPVVLIPGHASVMESFRDIIRYLTKIFIVHYVETREKNSSKMNGVKDFGIDAIGNDISFVTSLLGLKDCEYIIVGASLGATAVIGAYRYFKERPGGLILLEPNASFNIPWWSIPFIFLSSYFYWALKPIAKLYIKHTRVNLQEDYEMYRISSRALDAADPYKLKKSVLALTRYDIWDYVKTIEGPTLIIGASKNSFHKHEDIVKMTTNLKNCTFIDLETSERTHSEEVVEIIKWFAENNLMV